MGDGLEGRCRIRENSVAVLLGNGWLLSNARRDSGRDAGGVLALECTVVVDPVTGSRGEEGRRMRRSAALRTQPSPSPLHRGLLWRTGVGGIRSSGLHLGVPSKAIVPILSLGNSNDESRDRPDHSGPPHRLDDVGDFVRWFGHPVAGCGCGAACCWFARNITGVPGERHLQVIAQCGELPPR